MDPQEDQVTTKNSRSGNPAVRNISSAGSFKKKVGGIFTLPSGENVRLKSMGSMKAFLKSGLIPNDLMTIIQTSISTGKAPDMSSMIRADGVDVKMLDDMLVLMDNVVLEVLVEPKVHAVPEDDTDRDEEVLYIDEIDEEDKMFMFQWATGGTHDLERFRKESASTLDKLAGSKAVAGTSE